MSDDTNKSGRDEGGQGKRFGTVDQVFHPIAIEEMVGVLLAMGVDQDVDVRHAHNSATFVSQFGNFG